MTSGRSLSRFKRNVDGIEQVLLTIRLGEEFDRACLHGLHAHRDIAMAGEEDDRNIGMRAASSAWKSRARSCQAGARRTPGNSPCWRPCAARIPRSRRTPRLAARPTPAATSSPRPKGEGPPVRGAGLLAKRDWLAVSKLACDQIVALICGSRRRAAPMPSAIRRHGAGS